MLAVEFILITITLLAAIAGTFANPGRAIKIGIIVLAIAASIGTAIQVIDTNEENRLNKRLIASLVQSNDLPQYFSHDLVRQFGPLLTPDGLFVSGQTISHDGEERVLVLEQLASPGEPAGVIFLSRRKMNPIFYAYAADQSLQPPLQSILSATWTNCGDQWDECFAELRGISGQAMEIAPVLPGAGLISTLDEKLSFSLTSVDTYRGEPIVVSFDAAFITALYKIRPSERGLKILNAAQAQVLNQL